jgi:phosphoglycerate dehydrogenase-like enzyme
VTDPEPLSDGHPLWTHPRCIVTPHYSGNVEGELALGADIALANAERIRKGEMPYNLVDLERGY